MKWNWGTKIALLYSTFIAFILFMVYMSFGQRFDLVTEDYYAEEIAYQSTIDSKERAKKLDEEIRTYVESGMLRIVFPQKEALINGEVNCFRPSDEAKDFTVKIENHTGIFDIPLNRFVKGKYLLKINWELNSLNYYQEKTVIIP
jgi:hypothetical protein